MLFFFLSSFDFVSNSNPFPSLSLSLSVSFSLFSRPLTLSRPLSLFLPRSGARSLLYVWCEHASVLLCRVSSAGWQDLSYEDSLSFAVRTKLVGRVCTTNDGKNGGLVFHHEQAQTPKWPSKVFFFCEIPAPKGTGGGTGLSPSDVLLQALEAKDPAFVQACDQKGVKYTAYLLGEPDPSKGMCVIAGVSGLGDPLGWDVLK